MNAKEIVLRSANGTGLTVPVTIAPMANREIGPDGRIADCVLGCNVAHGVPVWVEILLRTDGTWDHWVTRFNDHDNHYLHIIQKQSRPITEAQRKTLARWKLHLDPSPYGRPLGASVCEWAFGDMDMDEVSRKYGDGSRVYLTAPCNDREKIIDAGGKQEIFDAV